MKDSRRKLLKSLTLGGGAITTMSQLPSTWSKPVVDSVILPAHAQTTEQEPTESEPRERGCELCLVWELSQIDGGDFNGERGWEIRSDCGGAYIDGPHSGAAFTEYGTVTECYQLEEGVQYGFGLGGGTGGNNELIMRVTLNGAEYWTSPTISGGGSGWGFCVNVLDGCELDCIGGSGCEPP